MAEACNGKDSIRSYLIDESDEHLFAQETINNDSPTDSYRPSSPQERMIHDQTCHNLSSPLSSKI
jgi:hypothetical protein